MPRSSIVSKIAHESYRNAPSIMPAGPWWENLESNFHARDEGFELSWGDWFRVSATAAGDVALRTAAASGVGLTAFPTGFNPAALRRVFEDRGLYEEIADAGEPERFFREPPWDVSIKSEKPRGPHFKPQGGVCEDLCFESPYVPYNPRLRKGYLAHERNRIARGRYWRHIDKLSTPPRPTIVAVHGFGADPYWLNEWFFALPWFYKLGCDVLLMTLPFHGRRGRRFSLFSGQGFFMDGISGINEALGQAICDFRVLLNYLEESIGAKKVGVTGVSLGGLTTSLIASVEPRVYFAIPNVPVVSVADLVLEWEPVGSLVRALLFATQRSIREIRHMLAVTTPLTYKPRLPKERLMIIGGVGDRLAPPKHSRLLWDHWGRCRIHWFPGSHIVHLDRGEYFRQTAKFLGAIGFLENQ